jgi:hypothetical protein
VIWQKYVSNNNTFRSSGRLLLLAFRIRDDIRHLSCQPDEFAELIEGNTYYTGMRVVISYI